MSGAGEGFEARMGRAVAVQLPSPLCFPALRGRSGPARLGSARPHLERAGRLGVAGRAAVRSRLSLSPPPPRSSAAARPRRRRLPRTAAASKMPGQRRGGCRSPLVRGGGHRDRVGGTAGKKRGAAPPWVF